MDNQSAKELLTRYTAGTATPEERALVEAWYASWGLENPETLSDEWLQAATDRVQGRLVGAGFGAPSRGTWLRLRVSRVATRTAAALALLGLGVGGYWLLPHPASAPAVAVRPAPPEVIKPGGNKAMLTLADGRRISLTETRNGQLASQAGVAVIKARDGQVLYKSTGADDARAPVAFNTISTPNGGQYALVLADGTRVWLNAASSLTYPTAFAGRERSVQLTGEAYFEVAKNPRQPFLVRSGAQTVRVLGTHFNVHAYPDEPATKTTLLEGSVRVSTPTGEALLRPGQQARVAGAAPIAVAEAEAEDAVAWKDGRFQFDNADLRTVMRQLQRWYDVQVRYEGVVPEAHFNGGTFMNKNLSEVLKVLELNGVHCRLEGQTIVVHP